MVIPVQSTLHILSFTYVVGTQGLNNNDDNDDDDDDVSRLSTRNAIHTIMNACMIRIYNKWWQMNQSTYCFRVRVQNFMYKCLCASRKPDWANKFCSTDLQVQMTIREVNSKNQEQKLTAGY